MCITTLYKAASLSSTGGYKKLKARNVSHNGSLQIHFIEFPPKALSSEN